MIWFLSSDILLTKLFFYLGTMFENSVWVSSLNIALLQTLKNLSGVEWWGNFSLTGIGLNWAVINLDHLSLQNIFSMW